jgi:tripartite-type tricarboxylate transporter receptor subunit TctC
MRKFGTRVAIVLILVFLSFLAASLIFNPTLHAQAPFYQGKSVRLIIGSQAGSLYDGWARLFANHMGKHIAATPRSSDKTWQAPAQ